MAEPIPGEAAVVEVWDDAQKHRFSFRKLLRFMGPGILMSIAYVDPGNLESDLQVGAQAGYTLLWLLLLSTGMGLVVQMQAAKLGVVTGRHLAQHCREQYPPLPRLALWLMAEVAIIGSDVQEVIGSAIALALLSGGRLPLWAGVLLTAADSFALLFIERLGVRVLEGFFAAMVGVMVAAFGIMYGRADVPGGEVVRGFTVPRLPRRDVPVAVALMGSLIMPHNIYLHSALVQSRRLASNAPAAKREALTYFGIESSLSLAVAVVINLFITAVFAAGFYGAELPDIGLQNAGRYLGQTYGPAVVYIWALGLLAAGQSSTMTGTYTGQFVMGGFLDLKVSPWARVTITRAVAIAPTLAVALLAGRGDGTQLDSLNQGLNLLQSVQLPFALVPVLTFTSSRAIMGGFANSAPLAALCWAIAGLVVGINGLALYEVAHDVVVGDPWVSGSALGLVVALYLGLIGYLVVGPQSALGQWLGWGAGCKAADDTAAAAADGAAAAGGRPADGGAVGGRRPDGAYMCPMCKAACSCCAACRCWEVAAEATEEGKPDGGGKAAADGGGGGDGVLIRAAVTGAAAPPALARNSDNSCALCGSLVPPPSSSAVGGAAATAGSSGAFRKAISACAVGGAAAAGGGGADDGDVEAPPSPPAMCPGCSCGRGGRGGDGCAKDGAAGQRRRRKGAAAARRGGGGAKGEEEEDDLERPLLLSEDEDVDGTLEDVGEEAAEGSGAKK